MERTDRIAIAQPVGEDLGILSPNRVRKWWLWQFVSNRSTVNDDKALVSIAELGVQVGGRQQSERAVDCMTSEPKRAAATRGARDHNRVWRLTPFWGLGVTESHIVKNLKVDLFHLSARLSIHPVQL